MHRKALLVTVLCGTLISAAVMTGCGSKTTTTVSTETASSGENLLVSSDDSADYLGTTFMGTIESVDGNTITVSAMGTLGQGMDSQAPSGDGSAPADAAGGQVPSGDGSTPADAAGGQAPSGDGSTPAGAAGGQAPSGDGSAPAGDGSTPAGAASDTTTPPEKPDGASSDSTSSDTATPPEKPDASSAETTGSGSSQAPSGAGNGQAPSDAGNGQAPSDAGNGQAPSDAGNGQAPSGAGNGQAPSDAGNGQAPSDAGSAPSGDMTANTVTLTLTINDDSIIKDSEGNAAGLSSLSEGDMVTVTVDEEGIITELAVGSGQMDPGGMNGQGGGMGGSSSGVDSYTAVTEITEDTTESGTSYDSTGTDENAIHLFEGAQAHLDSITVTRTSSDSTGGDNSSFYGVGAAILETDGTAYISNADITTDAAGGAGVFACGDGIVYLADSTISTSQDTSGGIHVAGGGTLYAWDCHVTTQGESSAAIRSDRGGGTMVVDGGSYTSNGTGSPAVYCTADITVNNAELTANGSEGICIEGLNTLNLYDCDLTGNMPENEQNDCTWNVIVYQSMSGDSEVGCGTYNMTGGSLTAENGGMFYTTNTESSFYISDVDITYAEENDFFLRCTGNSNARGWGTSGSNGADCTFTADDQDMEGDIIYDSISNLDFYMENGSTLTGAFVDDESCAGNGGSGRTSCYISADSTWTVTGNSTLTALYNEGTIVDADGRTVTIQGTDGTIYVQGTSAYTITVDSYSTSADFSGASEGGSFSDAEVENPF